MALCVGPTGGGKTFLLRHLQDPNFDSVNFQSIPTVGTNIINIASGRKRQHPLMVRELGGSMAPIWPQYYNDSTAVMFVVDSSDVFQLSAATVLLMNVLQHQSLQAHPFLIVFNKTDVKGLRELKEFKNIMRLSDILRCAPQKINVLEVSAKTGEGLENIKEWLQMNVSQVGTG